MTSNTQKYSDCIFSNLSPECKKENDIFSHQLQRIDEIFNEISNTKIEQQVIDSLKKYSANHNEEMLKGRSKKVQFSRLFCFIDDTNMREKILNMIEQFVYQSMIDDVSAELLMPNRPVRKGRKRLSETFFKDCELSIKVPLKRLNQDSLKPYSV